jgi:hypothetical protein
MAAIPPAANLHCVNQHDFAFFCNKLLTISLYGNHPARHDPSARARPALTFFAFVSAGNTNYLKNNNLLPITIMSSQSAEPSFSEVVQSEPTPVRAIVLSSTPDPNTKKTFSEVWKR